MVCASTRVFVRRCCDGSKFWQVDLPAANWKGGESPYFQVVQLKGISVGSKVDLQIAPAQMEAFRTVALTAENDGGVVTVFAIGDRPEGDISLQATLTEVVSQ